MTIYIVKIVYKRFRDNINSWIYSHSFKILPWLSEQLRLWARWSSRTTIVQNPVRGLRAVSAICHGAPQVSWPWRYNLTQSILTLAVFRLNSKKQTFPWPFQLPNHPAKSFRGTLISLYRHFREKLSDTRFRFIHQHNYWHIDRLTQLTIVEDASPSGQFIANRNSVQGWHTWCNRLKRTLQLKPYQWQFYL